MCVITRKKWSVGTERILESRELLYELTCDLFYSDRNKMVVIKSFATSCLLFSTNFLFCCSADCI